MNDDIKPFKSYDDFMKVTREQPPYRGTTNAYPLGNRKYSQRHFRVKDNGEINIFYANRTNVDAWEVGKQDTLKREYERKMDYGERRLATVFPDNSIQISNRVWMSDYAMIGAVTGFYCRNESRRGGLVISHGKYIHPGFKGIRLMLDSAAPHPEMLYETRSLTLKRKEANEYMKRYDEFLATFPVMLNAMGKDAVREMTTELRNKVKFPHGTVEDVIGAIERKHYCDAAILFAIHKLHMSHWMYGNKGIDSLISNVNEKFRAFALASAENKEEVFSVTKHEAGTYFPTSTWPLNVYHNDQPMKRF